CLNALQIGRISRRSLPEPEVAALHDRLRAQQALQDVPHEFVRAALAQAGVEAGNDQSIGFEFGDQSVALGRRGQVAGDTFGGDQFGGMAVEGEDKRRTPVRASIGDGGADKGLMTYVNAIERADGDRRACKRRRDRLQSLEHVHGWLKTFTGWICPCAARATATTSPSASSRAMGVSGETDDHICPSRSGTSA